MVFTRPAFEAEFAEVLHARQVGLAKAIPGDRTPNRSDMECADPAALGIARLGSRGAGS